MSNLLDLCTGLPLRSVPAGEIALEENVKDGEILILKSGAVEVIKHGTVITTITSPGALLGEIAVLLERGHEANAVALQDCEFYVLDHAGEKLAADPRLYREIACELARRLINLSEKTLQLQEQLEADCQPSELNTLAMTWGFDY